LRERELENCRFSQSDCTAIPTATVFIIPAFDMAYFTISLLMGGFTSKRPGFYTPTNEHESRIVEYNVQRKGNARRLIFHFEKNIKLLYTYHLSQPALN
jgi:hypothetical protein